MPPSGDVLERGFELRRQSFASLTRRTSMLPRRITSVRTASSGTPNPCLEGAFAAGYPFQQVGVCGWILTEADLVGQRRDVRRVLRPATAR